MARRSYTRDARGRFASTPGGSARKAVKLPAPARRTAGSKPQKRRGLLIQRSAAAASKRKLKGLDPADQSLSGSLKRRAQKGAVTRTANRLKAAESGGRRRIRTAAQPGVVRPGKALRGGRKALPAEKATKPAIRGKGRIRVARPTPAGIMRKSDLAKVKADARKGIGTPASRAGARAVARIAKEAFRRLWPQIQKNRDAGLKRIAEGKEPTAAQRQKERQLVGEYNKLIRKLEVAKAAK
jgi:hypothetical protein